MHRLMRLDDHLLLDIGLSRERLPMIGRGFDPRA
jgi:uncharacterized protein YjiS (DUF1127 family)